MEMQDITREVERNETEDKTKEDETKKGEAKEDARELKSKTEALEEAESDHYAKLHCPSEDVYSETYYGDSLYKPEEDKETNGKTRLYRAGCLLLAIICLILLLIIIVLCVKLQTGFTVCPVREETAGRDSRTYSLAPNCTFEQCQVHFPNTQPKYRSCQQCADGWLTFGQSCFFLSTFRMSWEQSQTNCTARGGSLAVISNAEEQRFLTKEGKMKYWIGLRKKGDTWMWVNNTRLQESFWKEVTPDKNCGILESGSPPEKNWITGACYAHTYFICQLKL